MSYRAGQIVWFNVAGANGFAKTRPVVILSISKRTAKREPPVFVAITTTFAEPPPPDHVELPWNPDRRRVKTGLARRSAAVLSWLITGDLKDIEGVIGEVPKKLLDEILSRLADDDDK